MPRNAVIISRVGIFPLLGAFDVLVSLKAPRSDIFFTLPNAGTRGVPRTKNCPRTGSLECEQSPLLHAKNSEGFEAQIPIS